MKRKKMVSAIAILLVVLMVFSLVATVIPVMASAEVTQADIDSIQAKKKELSGRVAECKERLELLQTQQSNVLEQKAAITEQNRLAQEQIDLVQEQIDMYNGMIDEKAAEVEDARTREERQLQRYRTRVRAMEESGGFNILAVVLQSSDFTQLLTAVDDMGEIMESDRTLEDQYIAAREETESIKLEYENIKADFEGKKGELKAEQDELRAQMEIANTLLDELAEDIEKAIAEYKAAEAEEQAAAVEVSNIIAAYNQQKAAAAAAAANQTVTVTEQVVNPDGTVSTVTTTQPAATQTVSGTGSFVWPVPCSMRVTSRYGNRSDPFTGQTAYHSGIDIDGFGNDGQPIIAADSGTVITASSNSGYGNYVIIDHGGTKTVYAHMSGFAVGAGQAVSKGQTVGYLGATGRATGTHLHFEVYVGDSRTDPAAYFSGINYYNC